MELANVPEIGVAFAGKLQDAGVGNVEALVVWDDLDDLALKSGIDRDRLESFRDAARGKVEWALAEAGISGPEDLAKADAYLLSERTGLSVEYLLRYRDAAQRSVDGPEAKVVLVDGAPVARVHLAGATHHAVPIVTAPVEEDDDTGLARALGDAVLLKPAAETVPVIIGGVTHRALPLYKERRKEGGEVEDVRVRVVTISQVVEGEAKKEAKKGGGLGKLFSRKKG